MQSAGRGAERCHAESQAMVSRALHAFPAWNARSVDDRAACLERLADLLERERDALMRLCVKEARKTIPDALGEVREAVDFCRYYAAQARKGLQPVALPGPTGERNLLRMGRPRRLGLHRAVEFPARDLSSGGDGRIGGPAMRWSPKPAPRPRRSPLTRSAWRTGGVPEDCSSSPVGLASMGAALVEDGRIAGIAFTGSTAPPSESRASW